MTDRCLNKDRPDRQKVKFCVQTRQYPSAYGSKEYIPRITPLAPYRWTLGLSPRFVGLLM
jgi:hypothetical protein